ncbi:hypothetical protein OPV22_024385 [Ensete ventricosum]|uniref:Secreted protein n=1 Tax=Ensete ventricosum TaxID=4639 RepID=A0AAV8QES2_ENSVE|nr:hypothetical protein OPV22_024385 [Ensete ventricosum]
MAFRHKTKGFLSSLRWRCVGAVVASPSVHCLDTSVGQIVRQGGPPSGTAFVDSSLYRMLHYSPVSGSSSDRVVLQRRKG